MNFGVIPETFLERVALWRRLVPIPILDLLFGPLKARTIMAGVRLGVFEALRDQSRTAAELADALRLDRVAIELLLRALTHVQYLEERKARYGLSPLARRTMVAGAPTELAGYARWNETQWRLLDQLETLARTGRGVDFHETLRDQQAWGHYQKAMLEVARFDAATLVRLTPIPAGATRLIDLAGGHGLLGAAICRRRPPMRSTVIDLPQALEHSRALAREAGHSDLVDYREGDLLNDPPREGARDGKDDCKRCQQFFCDADLGGGRRHARQCSAWIIVRLLLPLDKNRENDRKVKPRSWVKNWTEPILTVARTLVRACVVSSGRAD